MDEKDIEIVLRACEIAINKKVYSKEEIDVIFNSWNNLVATLDKLKRKQIVDELYKEKDSEPKGVQIEEIIES